MEFRKCTRCLSKDVIRVRNEDGDAARWKYICLRCTASFKPLILSPEEISRISETSKRRVEEFKKEEVKALDEEWHDNTERALFNLKKMGWKVGNIER